MRDPLLCPRPGDVVESAKGKKREVAYVTLAGVVVYDAIGKKKTTVDHTCHPKTWQRWAKGGTVVKRGPDKPHLPRKRTVDFDYFMEGQVTGIANKIMNSANKGSGVIGSTPSDEVVRALFEVGLACYLEWGWRIREQVKDRVQELCEIKTSRCV